MQDLNDLTEVLPKAWRRQPWMPPAPRGLAPSNENSSPEKVNRWDTHDEALATLRAASSMSYLSIEETVMGYMRLRGFLVDDARLVCDVRR